MRGAIDSWILGLGCALVVLLGWMSSVGCTTPGAPWWSPSFGTPGGSMPAPTAVIHTKTSTINVWIKDDTTMPSGLEAAFRRFEACAEPFRPPQGWMTTDLFVCGKAPRTVCPLYAQKDGLCTGLAQEDTSPAVYRTEVVFAETERILYVTVHSKVWHQWSFVTTGRNDEEHSDPVNKARQEAVMKCLWPKHTPVWKPLPAADSNDYTCTP